MDIPLAGLRDGMMPLATYSVSWACGASSRRRTTTNRRVPGPSPSRPWAGWQNHYTMASLVGLVRKLAAKKPN
jgi:hypothetical protein